MAAILVVEDEAPLLILAESYLEKQGHQTLNAGTPEQALALIDGEHDRRAVHGPRTRERFTGRPRIGETSGGASARTQGALHDGPDPDGWDEGVVR
jgi:CheY-like chemotaxis protein